MKKSCILVKIHISTWSEKGAHGEALQMPGSPKVYKNALRS